MTDIPDFLFITLYMVLTFHMIALKYKKSRYFSGFSKQSKIFLVAVHVLIVTSNIILYLWFILKDANPVSSLAAAFGILLFTTGIFVIFWGMYSLRKMVFVPENKLVVEGPYRFVRHPMYSGGITGAFGLAVFSSSLPGIIYSIILTLVLSHIADAEEKDLIARLGQEYKIYRKRVPKLFPRFFSS